MDDANSLILASKSSSIRFGGRERIVEDIHDFRVNRGGKIKTTRLTLDGGDFLYVDHTTKRVWMGR